MTSPVATIPSGHRSPVPSLLSDFSYSCLHTVQFYRDDSFLLEQLGKFIGPAIAAGNSILLFVTKAHRDSLFAHLRRCGTDFVLAVVKNRFVLLDTDETLAKFMVNGQPDPARFARVVNARLARLASVAEGPNPQIFVFGEMVVDLWQRGQREAALRVERLWNQLAEKHAFQLLCAYPMRLFSQQQDWDSIMKICTEHSQVIPAERPMRAAGHQDRLHSIMLLQQKTRILEREIRERKKTQHALQEREAELSDCLEKAAIGMHWIADNGTILWANQVELALSGYSRDEYVGHHISEFHVDPLVIEDLLHRLTRREALRGYEARLRCKDGSIRHIRIDSNAFVRNGCVVYTRCFVTDATLQKQIDNPAA
jgi:PAS domain S-box-containing protein